MLPHPIYVLSLLHCDAFFVELTLADQTKICSLKMYHSVENTRINCSCKCALTKIGRIESIPQNENYFQICKNYLEGRLGEYRTNPCKIQGKIHYKLPGLLL